MECLSEKELLGIYNCDIDLSDKMLHHLEACSSCEQRLSDLERVTSPIPGAFLPGDVTELPALAGDLRERLNQIAASSAAETVVQTPVGLQEETPTIPDYEVVRLLGRGGMGSVYLVRHRTTDRHVALKLMQPRGTAKQLEELTARFQREVRAVAGIEHENVVRLFEVGQTQKHWFYTMQLVVGSTLRERIESPIGLNKVAEYLRDAAQGVAAAHANGVLHRDIKPHNILISSQHDRALVSDFGLAKREAEEGVTKTGDVFGTVAYMSPEQTKSTDRVGEAADIYSLGATLYQCLTGRTPFTSESVPVLIRQINESEPTSPRQLNPEVPADLGAICLKCLEKRPQDRYATAQELADDLDRFLTGRPTVARPLSFIDRGMKWCRRNKPVVFLSAAVLGLLLAVSVGSTLAYLNISKLNTDLKGETKRATDLLVAEKKATEALSEALADNAENVKNYYLHVSRSPALLVKTPGTQDLRLKLLTDGKDALLKLSRLDEALGLKEAAEASMYALDAAIQIGDLEESEQLLAEFDELLKRYAKTADERDLLWTRFHRAASASSLASLKGDAKDAEQSNREAFEIAMRAAELMPESPEWTAGFIRAVSGRAKALVGVSKVNEALSFLESSVPKCERMAEGIDDVKVRIALARCLNTYGGRLMRARRSDEGNATWARACALFEEIDEAEKTPRDMNSLAGIYNNLAISARANGRASEATEFKKSAFELAQRTSLQNPLDLFIQTSFHNSAANYGLALIEAKRFDAAADVIGKGLEHTEALLREHSNHIPLVANKASLLHKRAYLHTARHEYARALKWMLKSRLARREASCLSPTNARLASAYVESLLNCGTAAVLAGEFDEGLAYVGEGVELCVGKPFLLDRWSHQLDSVAVDLHLASALSVLSESSEPVSESAKVSAVDHLQDALVPGQWNCWQAVDAARVAASLGRWQEAVAWQERAVHRGQKIKGLPKAEAEAFASMLTEYEGELKSAEPTASGPIWSNHHGFDRVHLQVDGVAAWVTVPSKPRSDRPWIWRARFPGFHDEADKLLLEDGFYVCYIDVAGLFGSPEAIARGDEFYKLVTDRFGLSKKVALEGVSRGGLFVYNWAAKHPDLVACIYCDTPVCDFKSWPGGKGSGLGHESSWKQCLNSYKLDEMQAMSFERNPIDHAAILANAKIPLMTIVSESDMVVPPEENTYVLQKRLAKLKHNIEIIRVKEGTVESNGHHFTHPDPKRVADFIRKHGASESH